MYIAQGYKGFSDWWRYLLGFSVVFIIWQFIGALPLAISLFLKAGKKGLLMGDMGLMSKTLGSNTFLLLMMISFVVGIISLLVWVKYVHQQSFKSLTTSRKKVGWKRIGFSFSIWAVLSVAFVFIDLKLNPENYEMNFDLWPFLGLFLVSIIFIPIQTSMEEFYMRGYLMQGLGIASKKRWIPLIVTSTLFGLLHLFNPEVEKLGYGIMVFYIGTGFFLGILTLMDEGLELALGFHAANNLVTALLVTAEWTAFQTNSIYKDISDPVFGWDILVPIFIVYPLLIFVFAKKYKWTNWKDKLFGRVPTKEEFVASNDAASLMA